MAKPKKRGKAQNSSIAAAAPAGRVPHSGSVLVEKIAAVHAEAADLATEEDLEALPEPTPVPEGLGVDRCWKLAREAQELYGRAQRRAEEAERLSRAAHKDVESARQSLDSERDHVRAEADRLNGLRAELDKRDARCVEQERELAVREANARTGFAAQSREATAGMQEELVRAERQLATLRTSLVQERLDCGEELAQSRAEHVTRLAEEAAQHRERLSEERAAAEAARSAADQERHALEVDREMLSLERAAVDARVARRAAAEVDDANERVALLEARLLRAGEDRDRLRAQLAEREEADLRFGHRTPEETLAEVDHLRRDVDRLRAELAVRPPAELQERFAELDHQREEWEHERTRVTGENRRLEAELSRRLIGVTELETLRDHRAVLEAQVRLLQAASDQLRKQVGELTGREGANRVFPACHAMDQDVRLQAEPVLAQREIDLSDLVDDLRQRIAADPVRARQGLDPLFYTAHDLRLFVGGLATSRLHILQGISGTGKTSLPIAFARAVGAGCEVVEVQAGWRDRDDLVGHYNAFEARFYEREFLKALYEAQCPRYAGRIFLVVLDEMNLSHPEHYFADLLSALERDPEERRIVLPSAASGSGMPRLFQPGPTLSVPPNVWFVGTANHDETTREFADKTYDRAHVMELPRQPDHFEPGGWKERPSISHAALDRAFGGARDRHADDCRRDYARVEEALSGVLRERFGIGWGNRFERQLLHFYPVVVAAGGTAGEAVDHMVATKLLRKLRDRHGSAADDLRSLRESVERLGERVQPGTELVHSLALLDDELRRHDGSEAGLA